MTGLAGGVGRGYAPEPCMTKRVGDVTPTYVYALAEVPNRLSITRDVNP